MNRFIVMCLVVLSFLFMGETVFAQFENTTDCALLGNANPGIYAQSVVQSLEKSGKDSLQIFKNEDMGVALSHLKQYCCSQNVIAQEACAGVERAKPYHPQSPYIFDHLMYVGMKKLDGIQNDCDVLGMSCETREYPIDPVARRDDINEIAWDTNGYAPGYILDTFHKYRGKEQDYADKNTPTMVKAYDWMCKDAVSIRYAVGVPPNIIDDWTQNVSNLSLACENLTRIRYKREAAYVRTLEIEKGTKFVVDNLYDYLNEYFIKKRMADLVGKYGELDACFNMVSRYVQKPTMQCNE